MNGQQSKAKDEGAKAIRKAAERGSIAGCRGALGPQIGKIGLYARAILLYFKDSKIAPHRVTTTVDTGQRTCGADPLEFDFTSS